MNEQNKALAVSANDRERKKLMAMIEGMEATRPNLKGRMTVAAAWYYMQLPDKAYGWTDGKKMGDAEKMLTIATTLALDLMPGLGHIYYLGNNLYISTESYREKAKKFIKSRKVRPCSDPELQVLDWKEGDRAIAIDFILAFNDERHDVETTGYGIVEKSQLDYRSKSGMSRPGLGNKKDIFQTLCTRAERDVFKHHIELHGVRIEPDSIDRENMIEARVIDRNTELPSARETETVVSQMNKEAETEHSENWKKETVDLLLQTITDKMSEGVAVDTIKNVIGDPQELVRSDDVGKMEAAIEAVRDMSPPSDGMGDRE